MATKMPYIESSSSLGRFSELPNPDSEGSSTSRCEGNNIKHFDVFISHRGPDTKQTLAYHMYDLLEVKGVKVFLDTEELQVGEGFPKAIEEAIECSRVHICILSSGYAESMWCLTELEMMMHKYEMGESMLIPIFYDVTPADVRHLKGAIGQGIEKQTQRHSNNVVQQWRNSLRKISDITGYKGKGELCSTIVQKVCQELDVGLVSTPQNVIGIQSKLSNIKDGIMKQREENFSVTSVEISGIGGIGKTTFAKLLYNQICCQFERYCFIEDVNGLVERNGTNAVHKELINKLFNYDSSCSKSDAKKLLKTRLQNADILVVLDNINSENCLSTVFIEDDVTLRATSTIIVTARQSDVLKHDPKIARYCKNLILLQLSQLEFQESRDIFCHYAFGGIESMGSQFGKLTKNIVKKCDGIPLALALFGKHVYGRDLAFWETFWNMIEYSLPSDLKKILRFSYDNLDTELEKRLFLDVAIFLRGEKVDLLRKLRGKEDEDDAGVSVALDNLESKLLIEKRNEFLWMHDLLVDLGRTIIGDESSCPSCRSHLWLPADVREVLSDDKGTDKVEALSLIWKGSVVLDEDENGESCAWSADAFSKMSSLEFLILDGYCIEGDLSSLSKRLLWLKWENFPFESIPRTLCLKRLRVLHLSGRRVKHLWDRSPKEDPVNLRQLSLDRCQGLQRLPEFTTKFRQLSRLQFGDCPSLKAIPDCIGLLKGLKHLLLFSCTNLNALPETLGDLTNLRELLVQSCSKIKLLPSSSGRLLQLQKLELFGCDALEQLPESLGDLQNLSTFRVGNSSKLKSLPTSFRHLRQINFLHLDRCQNLEITDSCFEYITSLRKIEIWGCKVPKLPCQLTQQNRLQYLDVHNISGFSAVNLPSPLLCGAAESVKNMENLGELRHLSLRDIPFPQLRQFMGHLSSLSELILNNCWNLPQLPQSMAHLSSLSKLELSKCWNLQQLPQSIGSLSGLEFLSLSECPSLQELPASIGNLSHLKMLWVSCCWNLQELPTTISKLHELENLRIEHCFALKGLPSNLGNLSKIKYLTVEDCWMVETVHLEAMLHPVRLDVRGCVNLRSIVGHLSDIEIRGCPNLRHMQTYASGANSLRRLIIEGCEQLPFPDTLLGQPHKFVNISLSLNDEFLKRHDINFENLAAAWVHKSEHLGENFDSEQALNSKASPLLFEMVHRRLRDIWAKREDENRSFRIFQFKRPLQGYKVPTVGAQAFESGELVTRLPDAVEGGLHMFIVCFSSRVYADDFADNIPLPFSRFPFYVHWNPVMAVYGFEQFNFGEAIHFGIFVWNFESGNKTQTGFIRMLEHKESRYPQYGAFLEGGWVIWIPMEAHQQRNNNIFAAEVYRAFYSEVKRQRLLSRAWSELPSQLNLFQFSALDIANCKITKIYRHCNTCIMGEEMGLTWKRRMCLFEDDHALTFLRNADKFGCVVFNVLECELQKVCNLYEMHISISISRRGQVCVRKRKLQQSVSDLGKQDGIPPRLLRLLQGKAFDLKSAAAVNMRERNRCYPSVKERAVVPWGEWHPAMPAQPPSI